MDAELCSPQNSFVEVQTPGSANVTIFGDDALREKIKVIRVGLNPMWLCPYEKIFFDPPPEVRKIKTKINKWDLIKLKNFCTAKETIIKMERQPSEWEKIFANEATDKGLISKIYKQLMQLNMKQINNSIKKKNGQNV